MTDIAGVPASPLGDSSPPRRWLLLEPGARPQLHLRHDVPADQHQQGPVWDVLLQGLH